MRTYADDLQKWREDGWGLAEAAMHSLYAVLLFRNGWLQDLPEPRLSADVDAEASARGISPFPVAVPARFITLLVHSTRVGPAAAKGPSRNLFHVPRGAL